MSTNLAEYHREWRKKNPEKFKAISDRYRNSETFRKRVGTLEFSIRRRGYWKKYRDNNKEKIKECNRKWHKENDSTKQKWLKKIIQRDGSICVECGSTEKLTLNHKIPRCIGGKYSYENLEIMCFSCNIKTFHRLVKVALRLYFKNQESTKSK